jgi:hypothetical protein
MREANMELQDVDKELKEIRRTIDPRPNPSALGSSPTAKPAPDLPLSKKSEESGPGEPANAKPIENDTDKND